MLPQLRPYLSDYLDLQSAHPKQAGLGGEIKRPKFKRVEFKRLLQVFQANVWADSLYRPKRYPGRVTLFKTASRYQDSTWGWGDIAAHGVALHQIPGHHMNVLRPPQVQLLAEKLSAYLSQIDEVIVPYPPR
jgi:hypothetical protein